MMEKNKKLVLVGDGEFALIAYEYFTYDSSYEVVAFSVERDFLRRTELNDKPVVPFEEIEALYPKDEYDVFVAIPASQLNRLRTRLFRATKDKGYQCANYISSQAFVWRNVVLGENCFIFENNTVQPFVEIGDNVILWSGNHIGHRSVIQSHCFIASHVVISGYCNVAESCFIGVNATLDDHIDVASHSIIASGSLVKKSLKKPESIYYGSPAKILPNKSSFDVNL